MRTGVAALALVALVVAAALPAEAVRRANANAEDKALAAAKMGVQDNFIRHGAAGHVCVSWGDTHMMPFAGQSYFNVYNPNVLKLVYRENQDPKEQFLLETRQVYARWGRNTVDNDFAMRCGLDHIVVRNHRNGRAPDVTVNGERFPMSRSARRLPNGPSAHYYMRDISNGHWFMYEMNCGYCGASCRRSGYMYGVRTRMSWQRATGVNIYGNAMVEADPTLAWKLGGACGYRVDRQQPNRMVGRDLISWGSSDFVTKKSRHMELAKAGGAVADPARLEKERNQCRARIEKATGLKLEKGLHDRFKTLDTDVERNIKEFIQSCAVDNYFGAPHSVDDMKELVCDWISFIRSDLHDEIADELRKLRRCIFPASEEKLKKLVLEKFEFSAFCGTKALKPDAIPKLPSCEGQDQTVLDTLEFATVDMSYLFNRGLGWGPTNRNVLSSRRIPFDFGLSHSMNCWHGHFGAASQRNQVTVPVNERGVVRVYTAINTWWGSKDNKVRAYITFNGVSPDGKKKLSHRVNLVGNTNIRDHNAATNTYANKISDSNAWEAWRQNSRVVDIQKWQLPAEFEDLVLQSMTLTDAGATNVQRVYLMGVTVERGTQHAYKELPLPYNFGTGWAPRFAEAREGSEASLAAEVRAEGVKVAGTGSVRFGPDYDLFRPSFLIANDNGRNVWHSLPGAKTGGKTVTLTVGQYGCRNLYTLINFNGGLRGAKGMAYIDVRAKHLDGSSGATHRFHVVGDLTARAGRESTKFANRITAINAVNVFTGPNGRVDMQTWPLPPAFHSQVLDTVTFVDNGEAGKQRMYVMGATVDYERAEHRFESVDLSPTFNYGVQPAPQGLMQLGPNYENSVVPMTFGKDPEKNAWSTARAGAQTTMQFPIGKYGVSKVYTVMNLFWGQRHQYKLAKIEFVSRTLDGAPGLRHTFTVAADEEVRNWKYTDKSVPHRLQSIKAMNAYESRGHALDMQTWELPSGFHSHVLDKVIVTDTGATGKQRLFMMGMTTDWSFAPVRAEQLRLKESGDFCVGLAAQPKPGVPLSIQKCAAASGQQQFEFFTDGTVRPKMDRRLCLTTDASGKGDSAALFVSSCRADRQKTQQWKWDDNANALRLKAHADYCVSLKGGALLVGHPVHVYKYAAQTVSMQFVRSDPKNPPKFPPTQQIRYKMDERYCVQAVPGNKLQLKLCNAQRRSQWFRFYPGDKTIRYAARDNDLRYCLKPEGGKRNKVAVTMQPCHPSQQDAQEWKITAQGHVGMDAGDRWGLAIGEGNTAASKIIAEPMVQLDLRPMVTYADSKVKPTSTPTMGATRQRNEGLWVLTDPRAKPSSALLAASLKEEAQALALAKAKEAGLKRDAEAQRNAKVAEQAKKRARAESEAKADAKRLADKQAEMKAEAAAKKGKTDALTAKAKEMAQKEKAAADARKKAEQAQKAAGKQAKSVIDAQRKAEQDEKKKFAAMRAAFAKQQAAESAQKKAAEAQQKKNTKAAEAKSKEATKKSAEAARVTKVAQEAEAAAAKKIAENKSLESKVKANAADADKRMKEETNKVHAAHHEAQKVIAKRQAVEEGGKANFERVRRDEQRGKEHRSKSGGVAESKLKADHKLARSRLEHDKKVLKEERAKVITMGKTQEEKYKREKARLAAEQKVKRERIDSDRRDVKAAAEQTSEQKKADTAAETLKAEIESAEADQKKVAKKLPEAVQEVVKQAKQEAEQAAGVKSSGGDDDDSSSSSSSNGLSDEWGEEVGGDGALKTTAENDGNDDDNAAAAAATNGAIGAKPTGGRGPAAPPVPPDRQQMVQRYARSTAEKPAVAPSSPAQCAPPAGPQVVVQNVNGLESGASPCKTANDGDSVPVATTTLVPTPSSQDAGDQTPATPAQQAAVAQAAAAAAANPAIPATAEAQAAQAAADGAAQQQK